MRTVAEIEQLIAGKLRERELQRDLFVEQDLRTTEFKSGVTFQRLVGREPIRLDPRFQIVVDPEEDADDEALWAKEEAEARRHAEAIRRGEIPGDA